MTDTVPHSPLLLQARSLALRVARLPRLLPPETAESPACRAEEHGGLCLACGVGRGVVVAPVDLRVLEVTR